VEYKILFTEDALAELEALLSYIRADNATAAERLGRALLSHVELLQDFPRLGSAVAHRRNIRMLVHFPILIYYRIHEVQLLIEILHFWHGSRQVPQF
jgi:plasmid stabilization system protein ParE